MSEEKTLAPWQARATDDVINELRPAGDAALEARQIEAELPELLRRFEDRPEAAKENLSQLSGLVRASEDSATKMANRGFFQSLWTRLTGQAPRDAGQVRTDLAKVQARAVVVIERLLERQTYFEQATRYLGARTELMAMENVKLKAALVRVGQRVVQRFERIEGRVDRLERRSDGLERRVALTEIFQSGFSPAAGQPYAEIEDPLSRAVSLCFDFVKASGGDWRPLDVHRLKKLAVGEAGLDQAFTIGDLVHRLLEQPFDPETQAWVQDEGLSELLMAPMDDETQTARRFYPIHFLLQRPGWFVGQGLPKAAGQPAIVTELKAHGLDTEAPLNLWQLMRLLLEERLAWGMESGEAAELPTFAAPVAALPSGRGASTLSVIEVGDLIVQALFYIDDQVVALGMDARSPRPGLFHLHPEGPRRVNGQPPLATGAVTQRHWSVGDRLWTLSEDRRGADSARFIGGPSPWKWSSATVPATAPLEGVAARGDALLAWGHGNAYRWAADRRIGGRCEAHPVDAAGGAAAFYLLEEGKVRVWGDQLATPIDVPLQGPGVATRIAVYGEDEEVAFVLAHAGGPRIVAVGAEQIERECPEGVTAFVPVAGARTLLLARDGRLSLWNPADGSADRIEPGDFRSFSQLAGNGRGQLCALDPEAKRLVTFELS